MNLGPFPSVEPVAEPDRRDLAVGAEVGDPQDGQPVDVDRAQADPAEELQVESLGGRVLLDGQPRGRGEGGGAGLRLVQRRNRPLRCCIIGRPIRLPLPPPLVGSAQSRRPESANRSRIESPIAATTSSVRQPAWQ